MGSRTIFVLSSVVALPTKLAGIRSAMTTTTGAVLVGEELGGAIADVAKASNDNRNIVEITSTIKTYVRGSQR